MEEQSVCLFVFSKFNDFEISHFLILDQRGLPRVDRRECLHGGTLQGNGREETLEVSVF